MKLAERRASCAEELLERHRAHTQPPRLIPSLPILGWTGVGLGVATLATAIGLFGKILPMEKTGDLCALWFGPSTCWAYPTAISMAGLVVTTAGATLLLLDWKQRQRAISILPRSP